MLRFNKTPIHCHDFSKEVLKKDNAKNKNVVLMRTKNGNVNNRGNLLTAEISNVKVTV